VPDSYWFTNRGLQAFESAVYAENYVVLMYGMVKYVLAKFGSKLSSTESGLLQISTLLIDGGRRFLLSGAIYLLQVLLLYEAKWNAERILGRWVGGHRHFHKRQRHI
jgi:hypothetical protein